MRCEALYHSESRHYFPIPTKHLIGEGGNSFGLTTATGRAKRGDRLRDCWMMWVATFPEKGGRWLKSEPEDAEISLSGGNMMSSEENITSAAMSCAGLVVGL
jgi:hypothetical protein